jgi:hypothetical protein
MLSRAEIGRAIDAWIRAWNEHDLEGVLSLLHDDVVFENWNGGRVAGKSGLRRLWAHWFEDHGGFRFIEEETFIDAENQKVLFRWRLEWPSPERGYEGRREARDGVDVLHFENGRIIRKLTYSKTSIEIDGERIRLRP